MIAWQNSSNSTSNKYPLEISLEEAVAKREAGAFILDVRQPEEWNEYHVPGSTLIPLGELASRVDELPLDQEIVVVCRSGNRSAQGRDILMGAGFTQVTSLAGGLSQWRAAGYPVVSGP
jgi:rhodanese-related sulfurtransferase